MITNGERTEPQRLTLRKLEAARALGISDEAFQKYVVPHVRCVYLGAARLYLVTDLQAFLEGNAHLPLEDR